MGSAGGVCPVDHTLRRAIELVAAVANGKVIAVLGDNNEEEEEEEVTPLDLPFLPHRLDVVVEFHDCKEDDRALLLILAAKPLRRKRNEGKDIFMVEMMTTCC